MVINHLYRHSHSSTGSLSVEANSSANVFPRVGFLLCRPGLEGIISENIVKDASHRNCSPESNYIPFEAPDQELSIGGDFVFVWTLQNLLTWVPNVRNVNLVLANFLCFCIWAFWAIFPETLLEFWQILVFWYLSVSAHSLGDGTYERCQNQNPISISSQFKANSNHIGSVANGAVWF